MIALIRPRAGGFLYTHSERRVILADASEALAAGAAGIAAGALLPDDSPDLAFMTELRRIAGEAELVFHRAFDRIPDMEDALAALSSVGIDRILTSAGAATAPEGAGRLRGLVLLSGGHPSVMPGGGITHRNAAALAEITNCRELHGSFSSPVPGPGGEDPSARFSGSPHRTDAELVRRTREALDHLADGSSPLPSGPVPGMLGRT